MRTKRSPIRAEVLTAPEGERLRFPKRERLKGRNEIRAVFNMRSGVSCPGARLFMVKNGLPYNRIAFTFVRKFGTAVERNRSRRISREAYRHLRQGIKPGWDFVLLVYPEKNAGINVPDRNSAFSRTAQLKELFRKARLFESFGKIE